MKEINKADIVISINGRDAGKRFIVIGKEKSKDGEYSLIADGKGRRLEKPKKKKDKHLKYESKAEGIIADKLAIGEKITNSELRKTLSEGGVTKCQKTT